MDYYITPLSSAVPCRLMLQTSDTVTSHDSVAHPWCLQVYTVVLIMC